MSIHLNPDRPSTPQPTDRKQYGGYTVRQDLAAKFMAALLSNPAVVNPESTIPDSKLAELAVRYTDDLMDALRR